MPARRKGSHRGPLRKIINYRQNQYGSWEEVLECGHARLPVQDIYGETSAARRRCLKCKLGRPADVEQPNPG